MKASVTLLLMVAPWFCQAQTFAFAGKDAVKMPEHIKVQIRQYIEKHDGISLKTFGGQYGYVPVFNVLVPTQKQFVDGIYYFTWGAHDSGRLFINTKGKLTFLRNGYVATILADYSSYLNQHPLPESTQLAYLSSITAFMKFRHADQQALIKSGALQELK
ncbi:hypothetical protein SAMN02745146_0350 [Hymenobacter daecheongensis DSM 21074]|uniref:DUF4468 domain-containing protein n=1 Tax=Hymenobacter daecheongensis DSM 21074 TaxID=1121955 RepID=A0A1M6MP29_9BACT|nr:hypothetical protein [Hymenobacter daecheongensis]SHJ85265.1 hypothetical protein SAMN02745146_0350 [Hymenobacter daecheongensis DSM 21074]